MNATTAGSSGLSMTTVFNLAQAKVMVVDDNQFSLRLMTQTLQGLGIPTSSMCSSAEQAQQALQCQKIDLLVIDCEMPGMDGYDLVRWLRHSKLEPNAFVPVLMISSHTRISQVLKARDCGANFILARPITPAILLDRILWLARDPRPFLKAGGYMGPDRRFKDEPLPENQPERRADRQRQLAAEAEAGAASESGVAA